MSDETSTPDLQPAEAIAIANREGMVVAPPLTAAVEQRAGDAMLTLRVTRMIGGVAREFSMAIGRHRTAPEFCELARKVWKMLVQEAEASKEKRPMTFGAKENV